MRIVAVEEHFTCQDLLTRIDRATLVGNGWPAPGTTMVQAINPPALSDTGENRIESATMIPRRRSLFTLSAISL
jgi:hypothetical protein